MSRLQKNYPRSPSSSLCITRNAISHRVSLLYSVKRFKTLKSLWSTIARPITPRPSSKILLSTSTAALRCSKPNATRALPGSRAISLSNQHAANTLLSSTRTICLLKPRSRNYSTPQKITTRKSFTPKNIWRWSTAPIRLICARSKRRPMSISPRSRQTTWEIASSALLRKNFCGGLAINYSVAISYPKIKSSSPI